MESNEKNEIEDEDLFCPITLQLFRDPVIAADGHVYEREAIIQWINEHGTSPITRQTLNINELQSDDYLRNLITLRRTSSVSNKYDRNNNSQLSCQQQLSVIPYNYNRSLNQTYSMQLPTIHNSNIISTGITQNRFPVGNQFCQQICLFLFLALIILFFFIRICRLYISNQNHIYPQLSSIPTPSYPVIWLPIYSGGFDWDSVSYRPFDSSTRLQYFYEAIQVNVFTSGHYKFWSNDMFTGYGYMYNNSFDPTIPKRNLLFWNGGAHRPFNLTIFLSPEIDYFLVVSSRDSMMMKWFSVLCSGPGNITLTTAIHLPTEISSLSKEMFKNSTCEKKLWNQNGITVAGGNEDGGSALNQLYYPEGLFMDDNDTLYIADSWNGRIVKWIPGASDGQILIQIRKLPLGEQPTVTKVVVDKNGTMFVCESGNKKVKRWFKNYDHGETIIENISCYGLTLDNKGSLYVSDQEHHRVIKWPNNTIVAGGNGKGRALDQFNRPEHIFIDHNQSLFVADYWNDRIMKWPMDAKKGIIVAGGNGWGESIKQLNSPTSVIVDQIGTLYIAEAQNFRITRWFQGSESGEIILGGPGSRSFGNGKTQLKHPSDLTFDRYGNLYVADRSNNRIQMFTKNKNLCERGMWMIPQYV